MLVELDRAESGERVAQKREPLYPALLLEYVVGEDEEAGTKACDFWNKDNPMTIVISTGHKDCRRYPLMVDKNQSTSDKNQSTSTMVCLWRQDS